MFQDQDQHDSHNQTVLQQCMNRGGKDLKKSLRQNGDDSSHEHGNPDDHIISSVQGPSRSGDDRDPNPDLGRHRGDHGRSHHRGGKRSQDGQKFWEKGQGQEKAPAYRNRESAPHPGHEDHAGTEGKAHCPNDPQDPSHKASEARETNPSVYAARHPPFPHHLANAIHTSHPVDDHRHVSHEKGNGCRKGKPGKIGEEWLRQGEPGGLSYSGDIHPAQDPHQERSYYDAKQEGDGLWKPGEPVAEKGNRNHDKNGDTEYGGVPVGVSSPLADDHGRQVRNEGEGDEDKDHPDYVVREEGFQISYQSEGAQQDEEESSRQHPPLDCRNPMRGQDDETEKEG